MFEVDILISPKAPHFIFWNADDMCKFVQLCSLNGYKCIVDYTITEEEQKQNG